ncbi:DsbA family oxidoreductase [Leucobacter sp. CSA2]|uniref:DsbA family oxidoreductase n=1 Tax=Leucobacter edaphi TaxID=2796472 RepID=A0A934UXW7_9MICO|nr:DsbA family oxidoreductase [Leucobacter edaphi]MBK0422540.1 DsbA family oxidoreductase [Leucobacter edaphi]
MSESVKIDVWSDIACPWCYIGKQRFASATEAFTAKHPDVALEIETHSFELAPDTPLDFQGSEIDFLVRHKGMPAPQVEQMLGQMTELGRADGIEFDFARVKHANTQRAHRILHLAKERGLQQETLDRLFRAYFSEGADMSDPETLAALGAEAGLDPDEVLAALDSEEYGQAVQRDIMRARSLGINGVPFFLLDQKYGVSGAQPVEAFEGVLEQVLGFARGTVEAPAN